MKLSYSHKYNEMMHTDTKNFEILQILAHFIV